jgi:hypothetical protein
VQTATAESGNTALSKSTCETVDLRQLPAGARVTVETAHSTYDITVLDGEARRVLMQGGRMFLEPTEMRIEGATTGGSALQIGSITVGFGVEFVVWHDRGRTSTVEAIAVAMAPGRSLRGHCRDRAAR